MTHQSSPELRIAWEPAPGGASKGWIADTAVGRLYVRRSAKGSRWWSGYINGKAVAYCDNVEAAMRDTAKAARSIHNSPLPEPLK